MFTSLRSRLILLVSLVVLVALALAIYPSMKERDQAAIGARAETLQLARLAANNQTSLIEGGQQLLVALAQVPAVREGDRAACDTFLAGLLPQYSQYENLGVVAPNGDLLCSALPHPNPVNYADHDWLQEAVKTEKFVIGQFAISRLTGKAVLPLSYPGLDETGQVQYVVFSAIDLAWLNQLAVQAQLPDGSIFTIIDRHGTILARYPDPDQWVGQSLPEAPIIETILARGGEGTAEVAGEDGVLRLYAFTPLGSEGEVNRQYISIGIPTQAVYAAANRAFANHLAGIGLATLIAIAMTWGFWNVFIIRRVNSLLRAIQRLAVGDLKTRTEIPYGYSEFGVLAQAFDKMAEALEQREAERGQAEERYRHLFETMMNGFALHEILYAEDGKPYDYRFLDVNPAFEKITGLQAGTVVGKTVREVIPGIDNYWIETYGELAISRTPVYFENYDQELNKHFEVFAYSPQEGQFATLFLDVTERKRTQEKLLRVNRALGTISECNQILVRADDEASLLQAVCQTLVSTGGYRMAWVGYTAQDEAKTVRPVAQAGYEEGYLATLEITWADTECGQGPTGRAIRTGNVHKVNNILADPAFAPWHVDAIHRGYSASIAAPLLDEGKAFGALNVYAAEPDAFEEQEERLLRELADNLAYGILVLRTRAAHRQSEQALSESEARYRSTLDNMLEGCQIIGFDWRYLYVNDAVVRHGRKTKEELWGHTMMEVYPGIEKTDMYTALRRCMDERTPSHMENEFTYPDGISGWFELGIQPVPEGVFILSIDITERKRAEMIQAAIYKISQAAVSTKNMDELNGSIHKILGEMMPVENFYIALHEPASDLLSFPFFVDQFDPPSPPKKAGRGLTEYVLRTGRPLLASPQVFAQLVQQGEVELVGTDSVDWLGVPLKTEARVIGVMVTQSYTEDVRYSQKDIDLLEFVSTQVALAIMRKRAEEQIRQDAIRTQTLFEQEQRRSQELAALNTLSSLLRKALTTGEMLPIVLREVHQLLHTDSAMVILRNQGNDHLKIALADGHVAPNTGLVFPSEQGLSGIVFGSHQPYVTGDYAEEPKRLPNLYHGEEIGPAVFVPLRSEVETMGVLMAARHRSAGAQPFSSNEVGVLATIGDMVGNSLRRARLFEDAHQRLGRVQALRKIDVAITSTLDMRVSFDIILEQITTQMGVDAACVLLFNSHLQTLKFAAGRGFRTDALQYTNLRMGEGYAGRVALERQILNIPDLRNRKTDFLRSPAFAGEGFVAYYAVPLIAKGLIKGVLEIFHRAPLEPEQEWLDFLETLAGQAAIAIDNASLFADLQRSNQDLTLAYDATIEGWSHALDLRDKETEGHTQRVTEMTLHLAQAMGVNESELVHVRRGALLHDIGKMGVPDNILLKPGPLTEEEWVLMRKHPVYAYEMLAPIAYLKPALNIPYCHHEKWDGTGYPQGLKGEQIPLVARIFAIVDVWDALTSERPYRSAWSEEKAIEHIQEQCGKHFDPHMVEIFMQLQAKGEL